MTVARLRRSSPTDVGWTRRRAGRGFAYLDASGRRLRDSDVERVRGLAIPPAWEQVWICPYENGHLQATGFDAAGRRQYLYHPQWVAQRDAEKFDRARTLGAAMPDVRDRVEKDLARPGMPQERAAALAVRLLDLGCFRIGSDTYAEEHGSIGLCTLTRGHVRRRGGAVVFAFTGKAGVDHRIVVDDLEAVEGVASLRRRREGFAELLAFKEANRWRRLVPELVNEYIRDTSGVEASAKDFRTWHATVLAALLLGEGEAAAGRRANATQRRRQRRAVFEEVAEFLGNTPTMARTSYVDPRVVEAHERGRVIPAPGGEPGTRRRQEEAERSVLDLLGG